MIFGKNILITGVAGFIASNVCVYLVNKYPDIQFIGLDKISYCSSIRNFEEISSKSNFKFIKLDLSDLELVDQLFRENPIDTVLHYAAYTHVDHSFGNSIIYTQNNVLATHILLEVVKKYSILNISSNENSSNENSINENSSNENSINENSSNENSINEINKRKINKRKIKFIHVSTDEVYGSTDNLSTEDSMLDPTNPYAATKAAAEHLVRSYYHSFKLPIIITRGNNVYGPKQYPEKVIPKFFYRLNEGKKCQIQGSGLQKRSFLHIDDVTRAFEIILFKGEIGAIYNIGSVKEYTIIEVAEMLIQYFNLHDSKNWIQFIEDRNFNDHRYNISSNKLIQLGWEQKVDFPSGLKSTLDWYKNVEPSYWSSPEVIEL